MGTVLFVSVGAPLGAVIGERWKGRELAQNWQVGRGAFWGRFLSALAKVLVSSIMLVVAVAALVV